MAAHYNQAARTRNSKAGTWTTFRLRSRDGSYQGSMIRLLSRACGTVLLAAGVAASVVDGTRSISASHLLVTRIGPRVDAVAWPIPLPFADGFPWVWGLGEVTAFLPLSATLLAAGLLLLALGRPRAAKVGFARR